MLGTDRWLLLPALKTLGYSANTADEGELDQARDLLIEAKKTLLAYDDTTFYDKLVSGEASLVEAWDGWCNYGIAEDRRIRFVVPREGSDLWVDTMVVLDRSENKDAAMQFIDFVLDPANGRGVVDLLSYKVPNQAAMEGLDPRLVETVPEPRHDAGGAAQRREPPGPRRGAAVLVADRLRDHELERGGRWRSAPHHATARRSVRAGPPGSARAASRCSARR